MSSKKPANPAYAWILIGAATLLVIVLFAGPWGKRVDVPVPAPASSSASADPEWQAKQQKALDERKAAGWQEIERGLLWRRISGDGKGAHPKPTDTVKINYEGKLVDGKVFDSSWERGEPATFPLGRLIEAWQLALPEAGVGDTIELAVPPALGYGAEGSGEIPGGAVLLFKIELLGIEPSK